MFILTWVEEATFMEGKYHDYFQVQEHVALRRVIRMGFVFVLFALGYISFYYMGVKWIKKIWIIYYVIVFASGFIRMFSSLLQHNFSSNQVNLLSSFYALGITPLPFLILWLLEVLILPNLQVKEKK
ncbi:hypothetical protein ACI6Q2_14440 [Chitinophagaceae bacterium LWZ2-11]